MQNEHVNVSLIQSAENWKLHSEIPVIPSPFDFLAEWQSHSEQGSDFKRLKYTEWILYHLVQMLEVNVIIVFYGQRLEWRREHL